MTKEVLYEWLVYLQKRIILQNIPSVKYNTLLNLLNCFYYDKSCINDPCAVITYLDCNLPKLSFKDHSLVINKDTLIPLNIYDCEIYDIKTKVFLDQGLNPIVELTLLNNITFFNIEKGNYFLDLHNILNDFEYLFPNKLELEVSIRKGTNFEFELYENRYNIGYFNA